MSSNSKLNFFALNTRTCCVRSDLSLRTIFSANGLWWVRYSKDCVDANLTATLVSIQNTQNLIKIRISPKQTAEKTSTERKPTVETKQTNEEEDDERLKTVCMCVRTSYG